MVRSSCTVPATMTALARIGGANQGRMGWQAASGYNWRTLVEADVSRFKRAVSNGLHSCADRRRATEMGIGVAALNRMLALGRPEYA